MDLSVSICVGIPHEVLNLQARGLNSVQMVTDGQMENRTQPSLLGQCSRKEILGFCEGVWVCFTGELLTRFANHHRLRMVFKNL